ncbi:MAG: BrnA antitoxin family protein [Deltaproteobacteria bacterium]|nr:BrnA antitoxin family protein [Deltaproteobacteria bacterium]
MRTEYDFGSLTARKNPYVRLLKQPVTIRLDRETVAYFKAMAGQTGLPYQQLINLYLRDCAVRRRQLHVRWGVGHRTRRP